MITARKTASATIETLANCRNQDSFESIWKCAEKLGQTIQEIIQGTRFLFKEARVPRRKKCHIVGESTTDVPLNLTVKVYHRISTYYSSLDKVIVEMQSRFAGNDQEILCALGHVILHLDASYEVVSSHCGVDLDILKAEKQIYTKFVTDHTHQSEAHATASGIVESLYKNDLHGVLPVFNRVAGILAAIPVTSCSAELSFSSLRTSFRDRIS